MHNRPKYREWVEKDYLELINLWRSEQYSVSEIAQKLGSSTSQIHSIVHLLRKNGISLPSKGRNGIRAKIISKIKQKDENKRKTNIKKS